MGFVTRQEQGYACVARELRWSLEAATTSHSLKQSIDLFTENAATSWKLAVPYHLPLFIFLRFLTLSQLTWSPVTSKNTPQDKRTASARRRSGRRRACECRTGIGTGSVA